MLILKYLKKFQEIFKTHGLNGELMKLLGRYNAQNMVNLKSLEFVTNDTLNIIFDCYEIGQNQINTELIKYKSEIKLVKYYTNIHYINY